MGKDVGASLVGALLPATRFIGTRAPTRDAFPQKPNAPLSGGALFHYAMLHVAPFNVNAVGLGLLPLHEPLKPGFTELPAGSELL